MCVCVCVYVPQCETGGVSVSVAGISNMMLKAVASCLLALMLPCLVAFLRCDLAGPTVGSSLSS